MIVIDPFDNVHGSQHDLHKIDPYSIAELADKMPKVRQFPGSDEAEIVGVKEIGETDQGKTKEIELTIDLPVRQVSPQDAHGVEVPAHDIHYHERIEK